MSSSQNHPVIQLEDGWNNVIKKGVSCSVRRPPDRRGNHDAFSNTINSVSLPPSASIKAIDVLERTLDDGFDTSFEPKEYIRIYT
jgi:hypothetical protein